jgi:4-hydroxy-2-oxoheptanedioate aldolase
MFDYVEFVAEYVAFHLYDLDNLCRAAELHDMGMMIKVDLEPNRFFAQRAIGSGFQSVLFADCSTVEEAQKAIAAARPDTPEDGGSFGVGTRRHAYMGYGGGPEYVEAVRDVVVVLMIEKHGAVEVLDEILSLKGLDMIQWGGSDYSMSVGKPGQNAAPEIKEVEKYVIESALKKGVQPRAEINSPEDADYYLDMGVSHFNIGTEFSVLYNWFKSNGEGLRKRLTP